MAQLCKLRAVKNASYKLAPQATDFMSNRANHNCATTQTKFVGRFCETPTQQMASDTDAPQFSHKIRHIYVHIPFCARICPYCAFYKELLDRSQTQRFCDAILSELRQQAQDQHLLPATIYFGGGTPTALTTPQLEFLMAGFRDEFDLLSDL